jgi:hypothetical protein
MLLAPEETGRFYRIWFALLSYVNTQLHLVPDFPASPGKATVSVEDTRQLRDALWANDALREQFIAENPSRLSAADLALVASWQYRLAGSFYIFRSLQKYTIFLSTTTPAHAYGVLGLASEIEETIPQPLPAYTQAVLLPFEHRIIYDSLLVSYNVMFGPGYRQGIQETYRNIQEREAIITSLLPEDQAITDFASTLLLASIPPRGLLDLTSADIQSYLSEKSGKQLVTSFKRFIRFLIDTGRIEYEQGQSLYDGLK